MNLVAPLGYFLFLADVLYSYDSLPVLQVVLLKVIKFSGTFCFS